MSAAHGLIPQRARHPDRKVRYAFIASRLLVANVDTQTGDEVLA